MADNFDGRDRCTLSLTARWWLLARDVFPLARDELPAQLVQTRQIALARALESSIHDRPVPPRAAPQSPAGRAARPSRRRAP